ncbi:dihydroorotate dehydrogenase electron transfer subunit [Anaerococcus porci]|uniref:Dihydroorotate dehydrogenase electron transfer subunit n=1 Tax=Anaerococcus porci TaxID=2652269 RepID=A0A6N7VC38_9FIRM|nr:dihydroorotate dehydrogenase electron transfer subunit [Anaerococcus porci]MDY3007353.1 dihydroorotate dehydrogenase electron transfer subunit [Anaerococcus porci]MSS76965.1 dihydroorotate dehydrogenase electron transfer subunit [Anaerococcus porci]
MEGYRKADVVFNKKISDNIYFCKLKTKINAKPGQFFMLRTDSFRESPLLSRPFGVCDQDEETMSFLYQVKGVGTNIIKDLKKGSEVSILGPLGNGFKIREGRKSAIVAGGIGIAPLLFLAKMLDKKADFYVGFSDFEYFTDYFKDYVNNTTVTIDKIDKIFITDKINTNDYDVIYACGPNPMLETLSKKNTTTEIQISMEAHMACGIGACLGCTIENINGDFIRVCKDGPVFDSKEIF